MAQNKMHENNNIWTEIETQIIKSYPHTQKT